MVGIVVVHYHNTTEVQRYLRALAKSPMPANEQRRVVIVDNGGEGLISAVGETGNVRVVRPGANLGYANGCSRGIAAFEQQTGRRPDWWIVSNTDVQFRPSFFRRLCGTSWPADTALLAPDIREAGAWPRNPFYRHRPSTRKIQRRLLLLSSPLLLGPYVQAARWKRGMSRPPAVPERQTPIYAAHGSLMAIHRRFFDRGGTLAYDGFLYGEEIHVAEQARRRGLQIRWAPSLQATHQQGGTMRRVSTRRRCRWWRESYEFLYRTYFEAGE